MDQTHYYNLINRFLAQEVTKAESQELETWLQSSEKNRQIFDQAQKLWKRMATPEPDAMPPFEQFWQGLEQKIDEKTPARVLSLESAQPPKQIKKYWFSTVPTRWLVAAAILLIVVGGSLIYRVGLLSESVSVYITQNAQRKSIDLPDGSQIELNAASELRFEDLDTLRMVRLAGQAFFEVEPDGRPFVIQTENAKIRVVGTSFDVRARDQQTRVVVAEGRVSFNNLKDSSETAILLTAGQLSAVKETWLPSKPIAVLSHLVAAWRKHKLVFEAAPLREIIQELERVYDVKIMLADNALSDLTITGIFEQQPVEDILNDLCLTLNLKHKIIHHDYVISK